MKDKQKRKKERTWAEAARLVRRAAEGASRGARGGLAAHDPHRGRGRGEALPTAGGAGPSLLETRTTPRGVG